MTSRARLRAARIACLLALAAGAACQPGSRIDRLPTGAFLDPAGRALRLGSMPMTMAFSPDSSRIAVVLSGYREQGVQIVDLGSRRVLETLVQPAAFLGLAFSPDGRSLWVSGGNRDGVYRYAWGVGGATLADSVALGPPPGKEGGRLYPAGLACSSDGSRLYVAENLADSLAVVDVATKRVIQRLPTGRYPSDVTAAADGRVYVSAWGGSWVAVFAPGSGGLVPRGRIAVGRHPSTLLLDRAGGRLYVTCGSSDRIAVVDTRTDSVVSVLRDSAPGAPSEGSTPSGLALSADGRRLWVAESDENAVALFSLSSLTSGRPGGASADSLLGRVPVEWYPTAVLERRGELYVLNAKGRGSAPNPRRGPSNRRGPQDPFQHPLGQLSGSLSLVSIPSESERVALSKRVAIANGWGGGRPSGPLPPFRHVIYVIRENRTFDQVLGDLKEADGDTSLTYFPRAVTPNAHALAERFGVFDRFIVNAEVSGDGHAWSTAAYASDYVEKTLPSMYSQRGRTYDYEGENRGVIPEEDVAEPANGYLWDLARAAGVSMKDFGEYTHKEEGGRWVATKAWLATRTDPVYAGWDLDVPDTVRAQRWIEAFRAQVAGDSMPALTIIKLPNDHTAGGKGGAPTPRSFAAENDLALGRIVEALTHSREWSSTVMFVVEDDAQDGPDHVDSHRSVLLAISPYGRPAVWHRFVNTTDVLATIDQVLGLGAMSRFDRFGHPLTWAFAPAPDTAAYTALRPNVPAHEVNPEHGRLSRLSRRLDLSREDRADVALFNLVLWRAVKGPARPYPAPLAPTGASGTR